MELVTAIVLTHNRKALLVKAIDSVFAQTYSNIECIVVDDASTDGTQLLMEEQCRNRKLRYIQISPEESTGGNHARNVGIEAANGKYIAFLDDDDEWMPEKIEKQVALLVSRPECGVCYCGKIKDYNFGERQEPEILDTLIDGDVSVRIFTQSIGATSSMLIKKELLEKAGMFDESLGFWQEYELCMRLYQMTQVVVLREHMMLYRVIQQDKARLSNKVSGWEKVVAQLSKKYADQLAALTRSEKRERELFICRDGLQRCKTSGNKPKFIKYAVWRVWLQIKR